MIRYQVNTRDFDPADKLGLFRVLIRWASKRGNRFEIGYEPSVYEDPEQLSRLQALGEVITPAPPADALSRFLKKNFDKDFVTIRGVPGAAFVEEMTRAGTPEQVILGGESPVDTVVISDGDRMVFIAYDYGTVQILELSEDEKDKVIAELAPAGLSEKVLLPIPAAP